MNPSYSAQRSACSPKGDARPPWRLTPTAACTPWVWTISTRCWRSILWWGGRSRVWLWTDWDGFLADPVLSRHQLTDATKQKRLQKKELDTFVPFGQGAKHDSQFKPFCLFLHMNIGGYRIIYYLLHSQWATNGEYFWGKHFLLII